MHQTARSVVVCRDGFARKRPNPAAALAIALALFGTTCAAQTIYRCGDAHNSRFTDVRDEPSCRAIFTESATVTTHGRRSAPIDPAIRKRWMPTIRALEARYRLPAGLFAAVVSAESAFRADAVSTKGAIGLAQLMPSTARELGVADPFEPYSNLDGGARYLGSLLERYKGDVALALAAYNSGHSAVARYGNTVPPFAETRAYVHAIESTWRREGAGSSD